MKNLKLLLILLIFSVFATFVSGCQGGEEEEEGVKLIKIWVHKSEAEDEGKTYLAIQDNFNDLELTTTDGTLVRMRIEFKNSADTLQTAINAEVLAGGLPDIVALDSPNVAAYVDAGILTNVDTYMTQAEIDDFVDSAIEQGTIDNKIYALFAMDAPVGLYYNKTLLQQASIEPGTLENPWSWNDLFDAMTTLKDEGLTYKFKGNLGFGGDEGAMYLYSSLIYSAGGLFVGPNGLVSGYLDSEESVKGLEVVERIFELDSADSEPWLYNGVNTDALAAGEVAFEMYGPWGINSIHKNYPEFVDQYDIMPVPVYEDNLGVKGALVGGCGSWGFGITTAATNTEAAAIALKYLTGADSSELLYQSIGTFPTHESVLENNASFQSGPLKSLADILINASSPRPKLVNYPKLTLAFSKVIAYIEANSGTEDYDLLNYIQTQIYSVDN